MPRGFYDADELEQVALNLFYGWGYNFYRAENQLRADDLLVRARACELLAAARAALEACEAAYRREALPPPSRERPRPDPEAMRRAQALEQLGRELGAVEGRIRSLPVPETDRMTQRYRNEAQTLARLVDADQRLVGHAEALRAALHEAQTGAGAAWLLDHLAALRERVAALEDAVRARSEILAI